MKDYNNMGLDDLDIVDLDDEDTVGANAGEKAEIMENDSEEFVVEEPYVVPVENVIEDQNDTEEFIEDEMLLDDEDESIYDNELAEDNLENDMDSFEFTHEGKYYLISIEFDADGKPVQIQLKKQMINCVLNPKNWTFF